MSSTIFFMRAFLWPLPMISSDCTIGTPDFIIVAIWRLKKAMSFGVIGLPALPNSGLGLGLTTVGVMPWRRSSARSKFVFLRLLLALHLDAALVVAFPDKRHQLVRVANHRRRLSSQRYGSRPSSIPYIRHPHAGQ